MADPSPFHVASMLFILLFPVILICWMLVYSRDISKAFSMEGVKGVRGLVLSYANNMSHIYIIVVWRGHNFGIVSALLFQNILLISKQVSV